MTSSHAGRWLHSSGAASPDSLTAVLAESRSPTPEEIATALSELAGGEDLRYIDRWERPRSGTFFLRFAMEPSGRRVVVKGGSSWSAQDAARLFDAQAALDHAVSNPPIENAGSLQPIGWIAHPPSLVMPDVDGTDVVSIIRDPKRREWESMESWMRAAGAMLAGFHQATSAPSESSADDVLAVARRMRIEDTVTHQILEQAHWNGRSAAVYGDFGPGNLIGALDGTVYLIDPPVDPALGPVHRDLGNFVFELRRQLAGHGHTRTDPVPGRFESLQRAVMAGYSERAGTAFGQGDLALVGLYEMRRAAGMARKRLADRPFEAVWFARLALARRREILRSVGQPE